SGLVQQGFWNRAGCLRGPCAPYSGLAHPISVFAHLIPALRTLSRLRLPILTRPCAAGQGKNGGVLLILPLIPAFSMLAGVSWHPRTFFSAGLPHGRPLDLLLPEPRLSRLRPTRPREPPRRLPLRPRPTAALPRLSDLPAPLQRTPGHAPVRLPPARGPSRRGPGPPPRRRRHPQDQPPDRGQQEHSGPPGPAGRPPRPASPRRARGFFPHRPARCSSMRGGRLSPRRSSTATATTPRTTCAATVGTMWPWTREV